MGVRIVSEGARYAPMVPTSKNGSTGAWTGKPSGFLAGRRSFVPRLMLYFDGTTDKTGLPSALAANETWLDPTCLIHTGETQVSLNAMYMGAGTCAVSGAMLPSDYAYKVGGSDGAALYASATQWEAVATLNPNVGVNLLNGKIAYMLYKFVFSTNVQPGAVALTSL